MTGSADAPKLSRRMRLGFALAAAACSLVVNQYVYFDTPVTTDENSYVFQARNFIDGQIARPCPPIPPVFAQDMVIMDEQAGWLSRYPPAHSLWLVPGVYIDQPRLMVALAAALVVWFITGTVLSLGGSALAAGLVVLLSPFFQFIYGTRLSHTSGLMAVAMMWWAYVRWQTGGRIGFAAVAGLAWSFLFLNRTYTGALIALPLGVDTAVRLLLNRRCGSQWVGTILFGLFALVGVGGYLLYNKLALGDPFSSTYLYYQDSWKLGFNDDHRFADGLRITWENLLLLDRWLWGIPGSLLAVLAALAIGWSPAWTPVCAACILAVIGGYAAFNYPGFNSCGPYYYFEALPFVFTPVGLAVARIRRWRIGCGLLIVLSLVLAAGSLAFMKHEAKRTRKARAPDVLAQTALANAPSNVLVFVGAFHEVVGRNLLLNERGLQSHPLVVQNWGKRNSLVARTFPDRACYQLRPGQARVEPYLLEPSVLVYTVSADECESETGSRAPDGAALSAGAGDKEGYLARGKSLQVVAGRYRIVWQVCYNGVRSKEPSRLEVASSDGRVLFDRSLSGRSGDDAVEFCFDVSGYDRVEPRIHFGGSGRIEFEGFRLEDVTLSDGRP